MNGSSIGILALNQLIEACQNGSGWQSLAREANLSGSRVEILEKAQKMRASVAQW